MNNVELIENPNASNHKLSLVFAALFFYAVTFTDILRLIATLSGISLLSILIEPTRNIIYIILFLGYFIYSNNHKRIVGLLFAIIYCFVLLFSVLINPSLEAYAITISLLFFSRYLFAFVMISQLDKPVELIKKVADLAWIIPIYVFLYAITPKNPLGGYDYSITFSYNLLLPMVACFYCLYALNNRVFYNTIIDGIAMVGIVLYGSRGTVICIGISVLYIMFFNQRRLSAKRLSVIIIISVSLFLIIVFKNEILTNLYRLIPNSRTLYLIINSDFLWNSNRTYYYKMALSFLNESPFKVSGLAGDTYYYCDYLGTPHELGRHSHNMFMELIVSFGLLIGGILCLVILYRTISGFSKAIYSHEMQDICAFIIVPLLPFIMVSGSLCQSYQYWLFIGAIYSIHNKNSKIHIVVRS